MPRINIICNETSSSKRLKISRCITNWFAENGSDVSHVTIYFEITQPASFFCGGIPLDFHLKNTSENKKWACVECYIHYKKDIVYMQNFSNFVKKIMGQEVINLTVNFHPTYPKNVFYLDKENMVSASKNNGE